MISLRQAQLRLTTHLRESVVEIYPRFDDRRVPPRGGVDTRST